MASTSSSASSKRKHNALTLQQKLDVISKLDKGESGVSLARSYNVGKATITDIKKNRDRLMSFASRLDSEDGVKKRKTMRGAQNKDLDDAVSKWFIQRRSLGEPISGPLLCEKALDLNKKLDGPSDFKASSGWLQKFQNRHGIRELQVHGEALSENSNSTEKFKETFQTFLDAEEFSRDDVYRANETGVNCRALPRKSLAARQEHAAHGFKVSEERVTGMTCANAAVVSSLTNPGEENNNDDSSSDESSGTCKIPSNADAFAAFETCLEWYEQQEEYCPAEILLLKRLQDLAAKKLLTNLREPKILDLMTKKP